MQALQKHNRIWIAALLALLMLLSACGKADPAPTATPQPTATAAPTPSPTPAPTPSPSPTLRPASGTDIPQSTPPATGTDIAPLSTPTDAPVPPTPLTDGDIFAGTAFFGNSLMEGLQLFGGLEAGDFYTGTSASVVSVNTVTNYKKDNGEVTTMLDALLEKQYDRILLLLGVNELGFQVSGFIDIYSQVLAQIAAGEPDATIYVLSLTPITARRSAESDMFTRDRIQEFNTAIAAMAERCGCEYMDIYTPLADADGWLAERDASDGIHFTPAKYAEWADFMRGYPYG